MHLVAPVLTRIFSAVLAPLALIGAGVVAVVEVLAAWLGAGWTILPDDTTARLQSWQWNERPVVLAIVAVAALGAMALLIGLMRRPPLTVPIDGHPDINFERHALEQSIRRELERLDGVTRARVHVQRERLVARVETNRRHQPAELKTRVAASLQAVNTARRLDLRPEVQLRSPGADR